MNANSEIDRNTIPATDDNSLNCSATEIDTMSRLLRAYQEHIECAEEYRARDHYTGFENHSRYARCLKTCIDAEVARIAREQARAETMRAVGKWWQQSLGSLGQWCSHRSLLRRGGYGARRAEADCLLRSDHSA